MHQTFRQTDSGDGFLYHYTSLETVCTHILQKKQLLLNSFGKANDPQDAKDWFLSPFTNAQDKYDLNQVLKASMEMNKIIRMTCFSQGKAVFEPNKPILDINKCGFCNPQMWHYYGDKNKGVCLVFDKRKLLDNFKSQYGIISKSDSVDYVNRSLGFSNVMPEYQYIPELYDEIGAYEYCKKELINNKRADYLLFQKSEAWSNEAEFRLITLTEQKQGVFLDIKDSLSMICFGSNTTVEDIEKAYHLKHSLGFRGCSLGKVFWRNSSPFFVEGRHEIKRRTEGIINFQ
ncbi:DUF2971 domain-containing protein [Pseudoalteromonas sp. MMG006]|uniref:DUF2971 domain-containing protein n=1 Tax=Pseudoalteromonas sp. MMG006 TaxID=2822683 RepID=UPI001B365A55|nr:DUF2971 domain-containing protein [Pseudoalteromonas sp. MMG006]MBQ4801072.1 DUF2971 domain-containing protein [Pseudoalteromonas sp. MMG006]